MPVPKRTPKAWSKDELRRLITAAATASGTVYGLPARLWWISLLAVAMDTGARFGELRELRWEWLSWDTGWVHVPAEAVKRQKSDRVYCLMRDTLDARRWKNRSATPK